MKTAVIAIRALLIGMLVLGLPSSHPASTRAAGFAAPTMVPITATFFTPITTYVEDATPAAGDKLTYTWSKDNQRNCGTFTQGATAQSQATWVHPDASLGGNCPDEDAHPGVITVVVSDGQWVCTATYPPRFGAGHRPPTRALRRYGDTNPHQQQHPNRDRYAHRNRYPNLYI